MAIPSSIFKAYDIRGKFPTDINEEFAWRLGRAAVSFFSKMRKKKNPVLLISRDVRNSSPLLASALIAGIQAAGGRVIDAGTGTTPFFYFLMHHTKQDGGIMVTASHNPPEYNGFKIRDFKVGAVSEGSGLEKIKALALKDKTAYEPRKIKIAREAVSFLEEERSREEYVSCLLDSVRFPRRIRVAVDAGGGATALILPELLKRIPNIDSTPLFFTPDGSFKTHPPNPLDPKSQRFVRRELKKGKYDMGVIFDGDGDRVLFFDEKGNRLRSEYALGLFAEDELKKNPRASFAMPINTSKGVREAIEEKGGRVHVTRVGYAFMQKTLRAKRAAFGVELSGHFYFKSFFYEDSALLAFLSLASVLSRKSRPLSELGKQFDRYVSSEETNFAVSNKEQVLARMKKKYADAKISLLDGITVEYPDWWANVRPSNTEPLIRLVLEAKTPARFKEKMKELEEIIKEE